jgi:CBS domain-containing protein
MEIGPLLTQRLLLVAPSQTLLEAARRMQDRNVGAAVVQVNGGEPGIITERDVLRAVAEGADLALTPVMDYMTAAPVCATPSSGVVEAARIMGRGGFRHLIVMEDGAVVGMLSIRDLLEALIEEHERVLMP